MPLSILPPAGESAGPARLWPEFSQQKTLVITDQGYYSVRATGKPATAPVALRITPNHDFEVIRYETIR